MSGSRTGPSSSRSWAGSPPSPAQSASSHRRAPSTTAAAPTNGRTARCSAPRSGSRSAPRPVSSATSNNQPARENAKMNKPVSPADLVTPKVTTGPIVGSRKTYTTPEAAPDLRVPLREIMLDPSANEPPVAVYDSSGFYTDDNAGIDVEKGLKRTRVERVRERG